MGWAGKSETDRRMDRYGYFHVNHLFADCNDSTEGERSDEPKCSLFTKCNPNKDRLDETDLAWHERTRLTDSR